MQVLLKIFGLGRKFLRTKLEVGGPCCLSKCSQKRVS